MIYKAIAVGLEVFSKAFWPRGTKVADYDDQDTSHYADNVDSLVRYLGDCEGHMASEKGLCFAFTGIKYKDFIGTLAEALKQRAIEKKGHSGFTGTVYGLFE